MANLAQFCRFYLLVEIKDVALVFRPDFHMECGGIVTEFGGWFRHLFQTLRPGKVYVRNH